MKNNDNIQINVNYTDESINNANRFDTRNKCEMEQRALIKNLLCFRKQSMVFIIYLCIKHSYELNEA